MRKTRRQKWRLKTGRGREIGRERGREKEGEEEEEGGTQGGRDRDGEDKGREEGDCFYFFSSYHFLSGLSVFTLLLNNILYETPLCLKYFFQASSSLVRT